jgi:preprotein translocase subunit SecE
VAKAATGGGKGGRGERPRAPLPPPTGQRTPMRRFVRESWGELRKVQWPTRQQVVQGTIVVGIVTLFFAVYLVAIDAVFRVAVRELDQFITG